MEQFVDTHVNDPVVHALTAGGAFCTHVAGTANQQLAGGCIHDISGGTA